MNPPKESLQGGYIEKFLLQWILIENSGGVHCIAKREPQFTLSTKMQKALENQKNKKSKGVTQKGIKRHEKTKKHN